MDQIDSLKQIIEQQKVKIEALESELNAQSKILKKGTGRPSI